MLLVGFDVLRIVVMKSSGLWDMMSFSPLKVDQHFGETYRLHLQARRVSQATVETNVKACGKQRAISQMFSFMRIQFYKFLIRFISIIQCIILSI